MDQVSRLMNKGAEIITEDAIERIYSCKIYSSLRLQFNRFYSCTWCHRRGAYKSHAMRYLFTNMIPEERNYEKYLSDVHKQNNSVKQTS